VNHHDQLKALLDQLDWTQVPARSGGELTQLYAQTYHGQKLFPAQHAVSGEQKPFCRKCEREGALLEAIQVMGSQFPSYRRSIPRPEPLKRTHHEWLSLVLSQQNTPLLSRDQLKHIFQQLGMDTKEIKSLLSNLSQHMPGGICRVCQEHGPLLQNQARNSYQILSGVAREIHPDALSEAALKRQIPAEEIVAFLQTTGVWAQLGPEFVAHFFRPDPKQRDAHLELLRERDFLVRELWQMKSQTDWQAIFQLYQRYVQDTATELIFHTVLPERVQRDGVTCIDPRHFFPLCYEWFLGEVSRARPEYRRLLNRLNSHLSRDVDELKAHLSALEKCVGQEGEEGLFEAFQNFPQWMGWNHPDLNHADVNGQVLTSLVLAVLWPQKYMIISKRTLDALAALAAYQEITIDGIVSWQVRDLNAAAASQISQWGQAVCREKNTTWQSHWLSPRKLDMLLYTCRGLEAMYRKHLQETTSPFQDQALRVIESRGETQMKALLGKFSVSDKQRFWDALKALADIDFQPERIVKLFARNLRIA